MSRSAANDHRPGALDDTVIEEGVKLRQPIQIGHNVQVEPIRFMAACVGIAGSTRIGSHCAIGGAARIWGHIEIADHVNISATAEVMKSITAARHLYRRTACCRGAPSGGKWVAHLRGIDALVRRVGIEKKLAAPGAQIKRKR